MTEIEKTLESEDYLNCKHFNARIPKKQCEFNISATYLNVPNHFKCDIQCERYSNLNKKALKNNCIKHNTIREKIKSNKRVIRMRTEVHSLRNKEIVKKLDAGRKYEDVAREHNLSVTTLYNLRRAKGKQTRKRKPKTERNNTIIRMIKAGVNYRTTAKMCGVSFGTVHNVLKKEDL